MMKYKRSSSKQRGHWRAGRGLAATSLAAVTCWLVAAQLVLAQQGDDPEDRRPGQERVDRSQPREEGQDEGRRADGATKRPVALGIRIAEAEGEPGVSVTDVMADSPADQAGIRTGDRLLSVDGDRVSSVSQMARMMERKEPKATVEITLERDGRQRTVRAKLEPWQEAMPQRSRRQADRRRPEREPDAATEEWISEDEQRRPRDRGASQREGDAEQGWLGVALTEPRGDQEQGALVAQVYPSGPAARAGLYRGDVIVQADGEEVASPQAFVDLVEKMRPDDKLEVTVRRDGEEETIEATLADRRDFFPEMARRDAPRQGEAEPWYGDEQERFFRGEDDGEECPACAVWLEQERHAAVQRQRIEGLISDLMDEVEALREEVRQLRGEKAAATSGETRRNQRQERP